jgi:hypothetical protein
MTVARTAGARLSQRLLALLATALLVALACGGAASGTTPATAQPSSRPVAATPTARPAASPRPTARATPAPTPTPTPPHRPAVAPGWAGPIYPPHTHGYDVSYPQCGALLTPPGATFSIVGVNSGKAFTVNPCLRAEWRGARGQRAAYLNSGYDPANADRTTADCRSRSQRQGGGSDVQTAYAIGCSEAVFGLGTMTAAGAVPSVVIWLDVESSNSWDPVNLSLNRVALQSEVDELAATGHVVGLYATFGEWPGIVGQWSPSGVVADWVAGGTPAENCAAPGFSGHPVWISQELATWAGDDSNWTC